MTANCLAVLRPNARYVAISGPKTNRWLGPVPHLLATALAFRRADPTFHQFTASTVVEDLDFCAGLVATGDVTPAIDRVVGLDGAAAGLVEIGTGHTVGGVTAPGNEAQAQSPTRGRVGAR